MSKKSLINTILIIGLLSLSIQSCNWDDRYYNFFVDNENLDLKGHECANLDAIYYDINTQNHYTCTYTTQDISQDSEKPEFIKLLSECDNYVSLPNRTSDLSDDQIELFKTAILKSLCPHNMVCTSYPESEGKTSFSRCVYADTMFDCGNNAHFYMDNGKEFPCENDDTLNCGEHGRVCKVNDGNNESPVCINKKCGIKCLNGMELDDTGKSCIRKSCKTNQDCEIMSHSDYLCIKNECSITCIDPYKYSDKTNDCTIIGCNSDDSICNTHLIDNAESGKCEQGQCTFTCKDGYTLCGSNCYNKSLYGIDDFCECDESFYTQCGYINDHASNVYKPKTGDIIPRCLKIDDWDPEAFSDPTAYCDFLCTEPESNETSEVEINGQKHNHVLTTCKPKQRCKQTLDNNSYKYRCTNN